MPRLIGSTKVLDALSALNALSSEVLMSKATKVIFYIVFSAGTTAGGVQIESSHLTEYTGTWNAEGAAVAWAAASRVHKVVVSDFHYARARISTAIVGGTVSVWAVVVE